MRAKMKVTIKDIAKAAGISHQAVSMVLRGENRISQKTREKVLGVAAELGYVPNLAAQDLRSGASNWIGLIVNDISNPFYSTMARVATQAAIERGYQLIITDTQWNPQMERHAIHQLIRLRARGVLLCSAEQNSQALELSEQEKTLAVVAVDTCPQEFSGAFVGNNTVLAGELIARHFMEIGCRNPVVFGPKASHEGFSSFAAMRGAFLKTLRRYKLSATKKRIIPAGLSIAEGRSAYEEHRDVLGDVDAIWCMNDLCAIGVMAAATECGREVGKGLAIAGVDDLPFSGVPQVSLTSLHQPHEEISIAAVEMLLDAVEGRASLEGNRRIFDPVLMIRNSTRRFRKR
jgi:LacI family transcriptional regulator